MDRKMEVEGADRWVGGKYDQNGLYKILKELIKIRFLGFSQSPDSEHERKVAEHSK